MKYHGKNDWDEAGYRSELARFGVTGFENFEACNTSDYASNIKISAINVSPNPCFDVEVYIQNYVNYANGAGQYSYGAIRPGQWTVPNMLNHIFEDLRMSAWVHYQQVGMGLGLDPSNIFSASSYLAAKAQAMNTYVNADGSIGWEGKTDWTPAQVLADLEQAGVNPIEDYFNEGQPKLGVQFQAPSTLTKVDVSDAWTPWCEVAPTPEPEPEQPTPPTNPGGSGGSGGSSQEPVTKPAPEIPAGDFQPAATTTLNPATEPEGGYKGEEGKNTQFNATVDGANSTITPETVISGGADANNTLSLDLASDWPGFIGAPGEDGEPTSQPNATNVQRLELTNTSGKALACDAKNIAGLARVDIDNGAGSTSVSNLGSTVKEVNIRGASTAAEGTSIAYADGSAPTDLTVGLYGVGTASQDAAIKVDGVQDVSLEAAKDSVNAVDVTGSDAIRHLKVIGEGEANVSAGGLTLLETVTIDAKSEKIDISNAPIAAQAAADAGANGSVITVTQSNATVDPFANNESTAFSLNGNIDSLIYNFTAAQGKSGVDPIKYIGNVTSDVSGDVAVNVKEYARVIGKSAFNFAEASGDVSVTVDADATWGGVNNNPLQFNAAKAQSFTLTSQGAIGDADVYDVVNELAEGAKAKGSVTFVANGKGMTTANGVEPAGITLNARGASTLDITSTGQFKIKAGDLANVADLNVTLAKYEGDLQNGNKFDLSAISLDSAANVTVEAGGMDVGLGDLGSSENRINDTPLTVQIANADHLELANIRNIGGNAINIDLQAENYIEINGAIHARRVQGAENEDSPRGDITLKVATGEGNNLDGMNANHANGAESDPGYLGLLGHNLDVDVSGVGGMVADFEISAEGTLKYAGSALNGNTVNIHQLGAGESSVSFGSGADILRIGLSHADDSAGGIANGGKAVVNVEFGSGQDSLVVKDVTEGTLVAQVKDFTKPVMMDDGSFTGDQSIGVSSGSMSAADLTAVKQILQDAGLDTTGLKFNDAATPDGFVAAWVSDSNVYYVDDADASDGVTIIAVARNAGWSDGDMNQIFWADGQM